MYFPYFRGRQYELLALKELASKHLITESVMPVIEPVKLIPALYNVFDTFEKEKLPLGLILNPDVGDLSDEPEKISELLRRASTSTTIIPSLLINDSSIDAMKGIENYGVLKNEMLTIFNNRDYLDIYNAIFSEAPRFTLSSDDRAIRRIKTKNKVFFENKFKKRNRNADYPKDEFFSDEHLYYKDDYFGFGDYSIVGDEYSESGFAPYAVAIHIVYFASDPNLRIRHFVSDSNDDISDVAGKFYQAVRKLNDWYLDEHQTSQLTTGLQILLDHCNNQTYPGLPTLKKLSIMHHLELMGKYLDGGIKV